MRRRPGLRPFVERTDLFGTRPPPARSPDADFLRHAGQRSEQARARLDAKLQHRERVVDLVCHAGNQRAERGQLFGVSDRSAAPLLTPAQGGTELRAIEEALDGRVIARRPDEDLVGSARKCLESAHFVYRDETER